MNLATLKIQAKQSPTMRLAMSPLLGAKRLIRGRKTSVQEQLFQNLSRLLVEDPLVKVDEFKGIFRISSRSDLFKRLVVENEYEPGLVQRCLELVDIDRDVLDIGANVGFYSVLFGKTLRKGRVLAVEPTKRAAARLQENINTNGVQEKVIVLQAAISNSSGEIELKTIEGMEEYSSLGAMDHPSIPTAKISTERVACFTVDEAVARHSLNPGFMKVDVEGMEHLVFGGASKVLSEHRPVILSELSNYLLQKNGTSAEEVIRMIRKYDYDVIDPSEPGVEPGIRNFGDVLCTPKSR